MSKQGQQLITISPQLQVAASPQRVASEYKPVRSVIIESAEGNSGVIYISDSESNATTFNRHALFAPGDSFTLNAAEYGNLDAQLDLNTLWVHGTNIGDRIVISFMDITGDIC